MKFADFLDDFLDDLEGDISSTLMKLGGLGWVCFFCWFAVWLGLFLRWLEYVFFGWVCFCSTARSTSCDVSSSRLDPVVEYHSTCFQWNRGRRCNDVSI